MDTPKAHLSAVQGPEHWDGRDREGESECWRGADKLVGGQQSVPRAEGEQGDVGNKIEEKAEAGGTPAPFPAPVPRGDICAYLCPPAPTWRSRWQWRTCGWSV